VSNRLHVVDGGSVTCGNVALSNDSRGSTTGNVVRVEGATSRLTTTGSINMSNFGSPSNRLEVVDGAVVTLGQNLNVGTSVGSTDNTVTVENATLGVGNTLMLSRDATLELCGTNPAVRVRTSLALSEGVTLRYVFDTKPPVAQPIVAVTSGTMTASGMVTLDIDADAVAKAGGKKGITLLSVSTAPSSTVWDIVTGNVTFASVACTLSLGNPDISGNFRDLLLDVPNLAGTMIIVR